MKKALILILIVLTAGGLFAQTSHMAESSYYRVYSDISPAHARETAVKLDAFFSFYSRYFHFDSTRLSDKLTFKVFREKASFDTYLQNVIQETRDSFVFLQYTTPEKNELVGFLGNDGDTYNTYLSHYSLIQYIKSFIPNPPLWLQLGFAVYFEKCSYNPNTEKVIYHENLEWLNTLKRSMAGLETIDPSQMVYALTNLLTLEPSSLKTDLEDAYAQSWGLVYFLINSPENAYNRILWDSISLLDPAAARKENEIKVFTSAFGWVTKASLIADFYDFIGKTMTFPELVRNGMSSYSLQRYEEALDYFQRAAALRDDESIPHYYQGLIRYATMAYGEAQTQYQLALKKGGDPGLTYYAMGVNAYAGGKLSDAKVYLQNSYQADPEGHGERAFALLGRIEGAENASAGSAAQ